MNALYENFKNDLTEAIEEFIDGGTTEDSVTLCIKNLQENTDRESEVSQKVDTILRSILFDKIVSQELPSTRVNNFFDLVLSIARQELCSGSSSISYFNEFLETRTVSDCELMFTFFERNVAILKDESFFKKVKVAVLRGCNDLLKRLYPNQDMIFSGRILIFLANFFYIYERSGLNLTSEFHQDILSNFSQQDAENTDDEVDDDPKKQSKMSNSFYLNFWMLQDYFRDPIGTFKQSGFDNLKRCCDDVFKVFKSYEVDFDDRRSTEFFTKLAKKNKLRGSPEEGERFLLRYVTNRKLFEYQLGEVTFRRNILLQMLILFQYLTLKTKFRPDNMELGEDQLSWVKASEKRCYMILSNLSPKKGKSAARQYNTMIKNLFTREEKWSIWKNDTCLEHKPAVLEDTNHEQIREKFSASHTWINRRLAIVDQFVRAKEKNILLVGTRDMNHLWNFETDNVKAYKSSDRYFTPIMDNFFEHILSLPEKERPAEVSDSNFIWRAFRLLGERGNSFFVPKIRQLGEPLSQYLVDHITASSGDPNYAEDQA